MFWETTMSGQPHPSNVYAYRNAFINSEDLNALAVQLKAFEESDPNTGPDNAQKPVKVRPTFKEVVGLKTASTATAAAMTSLALADATTSAALTETPPRQPNGGGEEQDISEGAGAGAGAGAAGHSRIRTYYRTQRFVDN